MGSARGCRRAPGGYGTLRRPGPCNFFNFRLRLPGKKARARGLLSKARGNLAASEKRQGSNMRLLIEFAFFLMGWSATVLLVALLGDRVAKMLRNTDRWIAAPARPGAMVADAGMARSREPAGR